MRWANNKLAYNQKTRKSDKLFRLDVELAGKKTILINRVPLKFAEGHWYRSYRRGFEKEFMIPAPDCRNALDYQRIVTYVSGRVGGFADRLTNGVLGYEWIEDGRTVRSRWL